MEDTPSYRPARIDDLVAGLACEMLYDGAWHRGAIKAVTPALVSFGYRRHRGVQQDLVLPDELESLRIAAAAEPAVAAKRDAGGDGGPAAAKRARVSIGDVVERAFSRRLYRGTVIGAAAKRSGGRRWRIRYAHDGYVETLSEAACAKALVAGPPPAARRDSTASAGSAAAGEADAIAAAAAPTAAAAAAAAAEASRAVSVVDDASDASDAGAAASAASLLFVRAAVEEVPRASVPAVATPTAKAAAPETRTPMEVFIGRVSEEISALSPAGGDDNGVCVAALEERLADADDDALPNLDAVLEEMARQEKIMTDNGRVYTI